MVTSKQVQYPPTTPAFWPAGTVTVQEALDALGISNQPVGTLYVDGGTTIPLALQDGSIGFPFATIAQAIAVSPGFTIVNSVTAGGSPETVTVPDSSTLVVEGTLPVGLNVVLGASSNFFSGAFSINLSFAVTAPGNTGQAFTTAVSSIGDVNMPAAAIKAVGPGSSFNGTLICASAFLGDCISQVSTCSITGVAATLFVEGGEYGGHCLCSVATFRNCDVRSNGTIPTWTLGQIRMTGGTLSISSQTPTIDVTGIGAIEDLTNTFMGVTITSHDPLGTLNLANDTYFLGCKFSPSSLPTRILTVNNTATTFFDAASYASFIANGNIVTGTISILGGNGCVSNGVTITGLFACAENSGTTASGNASHAEGDSSTAAGIASHAEGSGNIANVDFGHAEGVNCTTNGVAAHAEGINTTAFADGSHSEGVGCQASGIGSHVGGQFSLAIGASSFAHGNAVNAQADNSTATGFTTQALGVASVAEGDHAVARNSASRALGGGAALDQQVEVVLATIGTVAPGASGDLFDAAGTGLLFSNGISVAIDADCTAVDHNGSGSPTFAMRQRVEALVLVSGTGTVMSVDQITLFTQDPTATGITFTFSVVAGALVLTMAVPGAVTFPVRGAAGLRYVECRVGP